MNSLLTKAQKQAAERKLSNGHPLSKICSDDAFVELYFAGLVLIRSMAIGGSIQLDEALRRCQCALGVSELVASSIVKRLSSKRQDELFDEFETIILNLNYRRCGVIFLEEATCMWHECGGPKIDLLEFRNSMVRRLGLHTDELDVLAILDVALEKRDGANLLAVKEVIPGDFEYLFTCIGMADAVKIANDYVEGERKRTDAEELRIKNKPEHRRMVSAFLEKIKDGESGFDEKDIITQSDVTAIEKVAEPIDGANIDWQITLAKFFGVQNRDDFESERRRKRVWQLVFLFAVKFKKIDEVMCEDLSKLLVGKKKFEVVCRKYLKSEIDLVIWGN